MAQSNNMHPLEVAPSSELLHMKMKLNEGFLNIQVLTIVFKDLKACCQKYFQISGYFA